MKIVDDKLRYLSIFILLWGTILFLSGCGERVSDPEVLNRVPVTATVQVNSSDHLVTGRILARSIPQNISSLILEVYDTDTLALTFSGTVNKQQGEDPIIFSFDLPGGATYNFTANAYSQIDGGGDLLYQGTTSGVSISW